MKRLGGIRYWFRLGNANRPASRALLLEQFRILTSQIPVLYCVTIVDSFSIAYVLPPSLAWSLKFGLPGVLAFVCAVRLVYWARLRTLVPTPEQALSYLSKMRLVAAAVNAGFSIWALALFESGGRIVKQRHQATLAR